MLMVLRHEFPPAAATQLNAGTFGSEPSRWPYGTDFCNSRLQPWYQN